MRQGADGDLAPRHVLPGVGAGERVAAADVHGARAAHALAARATEGERRVERVLDVDDGVQHHRPAVVDVHLVGVPPRVGVGLRVVAVDLERLGAAGAGGRGVVTPLGDLAVLRKGELDHQ